MDEFTDRDYYYFLYRRERENMNKEELKPVDLGHLESKALAIVEAFNKANDNGRSEGYRAFHLKLAEQLEEKTREIIDFINSQ